MVEERTWPEVGCRVVRSADWKWAEQDGGEGHLGTVIYFKKSGRIATVCWDNGDAANYWCSDLVGGYDLLILDSGPAGIKHGDGITCDGCHTEPIYGARWICVTCTKRSIHQTYDLCSECYHSNKHDLEHPFARIDFPGAPPELQNPRALYFRRDAIGIVPGAVVLRGRNWMYEDQDGGVGNSGIVTKFNDIEDNSRGSVRVRWTCGGVNVYRLGAGGAVDLKCETPEVLMRYYKEHLPKLGINRMNLKQSMSLIALNEIRPERRQIVTRGRWNDDCSDEEAITRLVSKAAAFVGCNQRGSAKMTKLSVL